MEKEILMTVYSSKTKAIREVAITPSAHWGGQGLLGISIRYAHQLTIGGFNCGNCPHGKEFEAGQFPGLDYIFIMSLNSIDRVQA